MAKPLKNPALSPEEMQKIVATAEQNFVIRPKLKPLVEKHGLKALLLALATFADEPA